jgi:hypothetical protein
MRIGKIVSPQPAIQKRAVSPVRATAINRRETMDFVDIHCPSREAFTPYAAFHDWELQSHMIDAEQLKNQNIRLLEGIFPGGINSRQENGQVAVDEYIGYIRRGRSKGTQLSINTRTLFCSPLSDPNRQIDFVQQLMSMLQIMDRPLLYKCTRSLVRASYIGKWDYVTILFSIIQSPELQTENAESSDARKTLEKICKNLDGESIL